MIEFDNVGFTYDGETFVLDGVGASISQGEFVCILGGNGSGKSTLAKHVNALLAPDEGRVSVLGRDTRDKDSVYFIRSHAGMVFQNPDDQLVASLIENDVAFGPENLGVPTDELRERVSAALADVGLQGFEKRETAALSGGQKQRVAIAGVLAMRPQIIVFDESTAMLDPSGRREVFAVAEELNRRDGITIVWITHFMDEALRAGRLLVMDAGKVALEGAPREVFEKTEEIRKMGLDAPPMAQLAAQLREDGVPLRAGIMTVEEMAVELCRSKFGA